MEPNNGDSMLTTMVSVLSPLAFSLVGDRDDLHETPLLTYRRHLARTVPTGYR